MSKLQQLTSRYFPSDTPDLSALERATDLMFVNVNEVVDGAESFPPNVIRVGGLQIAKAGNLSLKLEKFFESGEKGSILFAMGTNFRSDHLTKDKRRIFIDAFRELGEFNFLWKFDENLLEDFEKPGNLMVQKWLPQSEILAHSKIVGFISHCGLLSTHEAFWFGVPIIGIPIFSDQKRNCERARQSEVAEIVQLGNLTVESIVRTVKNVAENRKYREKMEKLSRMFRYQKESPLERAVYWTEFLLENSADHLKSPTVKLGVVASKSYDVISLLLLSIYVLLKLAGKLFSTLSTYYKQCRSKKMKQS
jgi:glucuronosyltransferase